MVLNQHKIMLYLPFVDLTMIYLIMLLLLFSPLPLDCIVHQMNLFEIKKNKLNKQFKVTTMTSLITQRLILEIIQ